jgi:hypothetical protein
MKLCKKCGSLRFGENCSNESCSEHYKTDERVLSEMLNEKAKHIVRSTPYERTRATVYATGNKWAIENFNATHS